MKDDPAGVAGTSATLSSADQTVGHSRFLESKEACCKHRLCLGKRHLVQISILQRLLYE